MAKATTKTPPEEQGTAVVPTNEVAYPVSLADLAKDSGLGNENMGMKDVTTPYFAVLQGLSPQVQPGHGKAIEGAVQGMWINTATNELFDGASSGPRPLLFIPCAYERKIIEWLDRDAGGGGYVGEHDLDSDIMSFTERDPEKGFQRLKSDPTHILVETAYHYGLGYSHESKMWEGGILSLKSTGLKPNRAWNAALTRMTIDLPNHGVIQAPRWLYPWRMQTVLETSKKGKSYFNIQPVRMENPVTPGLYSQAREFYKQFGAGLIKRAVEEDAPAKTGDDEIPF